MLDKIIELISNQDFSKLKELLSEENPADISEWLSEMEGQDATAVFRLLNKNDAAEVFAYMEPDLQEKIVNLLSDSELAEITSKLYVDDAADLIEEMPANLVTRILNNTPKEKRDVINQLLRYPEFSAGTIMTTEYISITKDMNVKEAFDQIRKTGLKKETINIIYVVDKERHLVGVVTVKDLLMAQYEDKINDIMETNIITINTHDDQEVVAEMFDKYDFLAMPVVDMENRLVGIVTVDDAIDVLVEEADEDLQIMNAIAPSDEDYFKEPVIVQYKNRIVWLLFLMLSSIITGVIIEKYELAFAAYPILVSFIPMIMDTGGNCGSQSSTVIIRGIATGEVEFKDLFRAWWKEIRIALLCGVTLAVVNGIRIMIQFGDMQLAIVLGFTLIFTVSLAKSLGCFLPLLAKKLNMDPAYMASPLITTIADACSLIIFFNIAVFIMHIG